MKIRNVTWIRLMFLSVLAALACGCGRWVPSESPTVSLEEAGPGFEKVISWLRSNGYDVDQVDDARRFVRAKAKLDGDTVLEAVAPFTPPKAVERISYFGFQVDEAGALKITPSGYHVRSDDGGVMHAALKEELDQIIAGLR